MRLSVERSDESLSLKTSLGRRVADYLAGEPFVNARQ